MWYLGLPSEAAVHRGDDGLSVDDRHRRDVREQLSGWGYAQYLNLAQLAGHDVKVADGFALPPVYSLDDTPEPPVVTETSQMATFFGQP